MPTIISEKELKSLDNILIKERECTWALEAEIDYNAKLDFSDSSGDEESEEQKKSSSTATSSSTSKPTVIDATKKSDLRSTTTGIVVSKDDRLAASSANAPAETQGSLLGDPPRVGPNTLGPTPPFNQDRSSYVGRKSDSVYEFNRKYQEVCFVVNLYRVRHQLFVETFGSTMINSPMTETTC